MTFSYVDGVKVATYISYPILKLLQFLLKNSWSFAFILAWDILDGEDPASVKRSVRNFQNYGVRNRETLGELFVSFLIKVTSLSVNAGN